MTQIAIMIFESPYGREKVYTAMRFALTALTDGHQVTIILIQDGIFVGKKDQKPSDYPNLAEYLQNAIDQGLKVIACGVCCNARGVKQDDFIDGITIVGMHEIVQAVTESDKTLTF
jgi:tRNA 2-thiouridine synthesizing protein D